MRPSVLSPTSMMARSFSMPTTLPLTTVPSSGSLSMNEFMSICSKSSLVTVCCAKCCLHVHQMSCDAAKACDAGRPRMQHGPVHGRRPQGRSFHDIYAGLEGLPWLGSQGRKVGLGARLGRRLARNGPIDHGDGRAECGLYIQTRRIE